MKRYPLPHMLMLLSTMMLSGIFLIFPAPDSVQANYFRKMDDSSQTQTQVASSSATPIVTATATAITNTMTPTIIPTATFSQVPKPRLKKELIDYKAYLWWVVNRKSNTVLCDFSIEHIDAPTSADIYYGCDESVYKEWEKNETCDPSSNDGNSDCNKIYTYRVKEFNSQKEATVEIPPPSAWLSLEGCSVDGVTNICNSPPSLKINGEEPMNGEKIIKIEGTANGASFNCDGETCSILLPTNSDSVRFEFWLIQAWVIRAVAFLRWLESEQGMWPYPGRIQQLKYGMLILPANNGAIPLPRQPALKRGKHYRMWVRLLTGFQISARWELSNLKPAIITLPAN